VDDQQQQLHWYAALVLATPVPVDLVVVPHEAQHLVVVGTSLRKPKPILEAYLTSLAWQVPPRNVQFLYAFIDDGLDAEARALVEQFVAERGGILQPSGAVPTADFSDHHPVTHQWSDTAMQRVGANKDWLLGFARANRADAIWLCDADLIMDPMTFADLWSIPEQIVCGVYYTRWQKTPSEQNPVHAGPQVWQSHPYTLSGNGMDEWELRRRLVNRQIVHVYGQGACTLIRKDALLRGVSFAPVPGNNGPGLMQGEDRHFCLRAEQLHLKMVASGWADIFHVYHRPEDELRIPEMLQRLMGLQRDATGPVQPQLGDLVSLTLRALEPVPTQTGMMYPPTQQVRGRLGKLALHPELEDAILHMERGESRVVPVHFGLDYPFPPYRGERRLIHATLIDHKPFGYPPVIEDELLQNSVGSAIDTTTLPPETVELIKEIHAA
jgi:hypothetical protein